MLAMRLATEADRWRVFAWRNLPEVYAQGINAYPVSRMEHEQWFTEVLGPNHLLWILEPDAGTVRIDLGSTSAWLTIYLLPAFQGKGHGPDIIQEVCRRAFKEKPWLREIRAAVKDDNEKSLRAFTRAGFHIEMVKDAPLSR